MGVSMNFKELLQRIKFRDIFAITIWGSIVGSFIAHGSGAIHLPDQVIGAFIVIAQTVVFFYFRKRGRVEGSS